MLAGFGGLAHAGTFSFSFYGLTDTNNGANNNAAIASYMDGILGCASCVTVTGAAVDETYTGDGHVVGPNGVPDTLGNTTGATGNNASTVAPHTFLATSTDNGTQISTEISIAISGMTITSVSFDYEIFPDGSCQYLGGGCGSNNSYLPSIEFATGASNTLDSAFGTGGVVNAVAPGNGDGGNTHSTASGIHSTEYAPQYIGASGTIAVPNASQLDFIDWPATIGIDNLTINYSGTFPGSASPVPEPTSVILLATASLGAAVALRRKLNQVS